jgi:hypothetical protein
VETRFGFISGCAAIAESDRGVASRTGTLPPASPRFRPKPTHYVDAPLSTFRPCPCWQQRMTRARGGPLTLQLRLFHSQHRAGLSRRTEDFTCHGL